MRREHFIWLIPILVGAVAYWRADAMHGIAEEVKISGRSSDEGRGSERRLRSRSEVEAELEKLRVEMRAEEKGTADEFAVMSVERLKEEILGLKKQIEDAENAKDWSNLNDLRRRLWVVSGHLASSAGEPGINWILEHCPEVRRSYMAAWAKVDPEKTFRYIENSRQPGICSTDTVMELLDRLAKNNPQALKSAVERLPWELFVFDEDPFTTDETGLRPGLAEADDVKLWLESGVARQMAEQGVYINNLFSKWADEDLPGALAGWSGWPAQERKGWMWELASMLEMSSRSPEGLERLESALSGLDENATGKVREALGRLQAIEPDQMKDLNGKIPALGELNLSPASPP